MKTILTTIALVTLMMTSTAWAANDSVVSQTPSADAFKATISLIDGDTLRFLVLNPDEDEVVVKVYSENDLKVMEYDLDRKKGVKLTYVMAEMKKCCYTAVVEHNDEEVARKKVTIK